MPIGKYKLRHTNKNETAPHPPPSHPFRIRAKRPLRRRQSVDYKIANLITPFAGVAGQPLLFLLLLFLLQF